MHISTLEPPHLWLSKEEMEATGGRARRNHDSQVDPDARAGRGEVAGSSLTIRTYLEVSAVASLTHNNVEAYSAANGELPKLGDPYEPDISA